MPYLCRSQPNRPSILALYAVDASGFLYDPETVEFRIIDLTSKAQVFPVSGWADVTTDGRVDLGVFYAYDTGTSDGWAPDVAATIGPYRIDWRFTDADDDTVTRTWSFKFDVYSSGYEIGYWTYLTPNKVRAEGISTGMVADARLVELIERTQQYIERECRQPFRPTRFTLEFDGNGSPLYQLGIPIIGIDNFKINHSDIELGHEQFAVYWSPSLRDDPGYVPLDYRKNPKVKLTAEFSASPFRSGTYGSSYSPSRMAPGAKPHRLKGVFGFLEPDGTTPKLITDAMLRVVLATATLMDVGAGGQGTGISGPITREKTDTHEIDYGFSYTASSMDSPLATSGEVLDIVRRYRAPIGIAAPATTWASLRF